jgi:hypothetical protein
MEARIIGAPEEPDDAVGERPAEGGRRHERAADGPLPAGGTGDPVCQLVARRGLVSRSGRSSALTRSSAGSLMPAAPSRTYSCVRVRSLIFGRVRRRQLRAPSDRRQRGVVGDAEQPRAERRLAPEPVETVERSQERVLRDVFRVVVPYYARGHAQDDLVVAHDELLERAQVAAPGPLDESLIRDGRHRQLGARGPRNVRYRFSGRPLRQALPSGGNRANDGPSFLTLFSAVNVGDSVQTGLDSFFGFPTQAAALSDP